MSDQRDSADDSRALIQRIKDSEVRAGLDAAISKNILPAADERPYPGHFMITADGSTYGGDSTWPGLDSWQMAGAFLLLGRSRLVKDYFDYLRASQRKDGNIPFAIFTGDTRADSTYLSGLKAEDVFTYKPPKREGLPASSQVTRQWIGLFKHWEPKADPLSTLGPVCHILTGAEIYDATHDRAWLVERLPSIEAAAKYLASRIEPNGLVSGSGFYVELPPRYGFDGVTQCYAVHSFNEVARLCRAAGKKQEAIHWSTLVGTLKMSVVDAFWRGDHFGEYVHAERGLIDSHGLSDTNWAAVAFGIADDRHIKLLWPRLIAEKGFWLGGMPTQLVTKPFAYEEWEDEKVPFEVPHLNDVAAMGRVWYLEAMACRRMKAHDRLLESARLVSRAAKNGYWRERYKPLPNGQILPDRADKYCEYAAVLTRVVLGSPEVFGA